MSGIGVLFRLRLSKLASAIGLADRARAFSSGRKEWKWESRAAFCQTHGPRMDPAAPSTSSSQPSDAMPDELLAAGALTPAKVVEVLDRYIVGQTAAKRAVAVAFRMRFSRAWCCGKTEIARRLAKISYAPFVKVEATKFTEVGFHGRDVDQIIRDLVDNAIVLQRQRIRTKISKEVEKSVEDRILDVLVGVQQEEISEKSLTSMDMFRKLYREGAIDNRKIQLDVPEGRVRLPVDVMGNGLPVNDLIYKVLKSPKVERREITVGEARPLLTEIEMEKYLQSDQIVKDAIQLTESDGIVFIDEIDKIVTTSETRRGADASAEGVQRDLLPIIEGSVVNTKYGNVNTDHILFICSGAFHSCKPSDMLAELQGRLPIRVELKALQREDLYRILTEPEINMLKQQQLLLETEGVELIFTEDAVRELANVAAEVNRSLDNIGARRLHTVIERVVEDISFSAPERAGEKLIIDKEKVRKSVGDLLNKMDLSKFVL
ncbi:hypothetical protein SELMODRAFT_439468 [Selaginella moellendorffii]|uniref:Clp ATPase C-terminal domain-containing protein n=1 Tax=Selaginella moellendorffii TaxID=88036 RepID=D8R4P7_SELML|nr:hypothetical protein SELMODRAFT_439468 [Selaginella moellendorffii]